MKIKNLLSKGRCVFLAYDHGVEHGPADFNMRSVDPENILNLALESNYNGIVLHHGVVEKYYHGSYKEIPLIMKLNGKTNIPHISPVSRQICTVERALKLGASGVGYTIYDGSPAEPEMFQEFSKVVEEAHDYGLPVIAWICPGGPDIKNETSTEMLAYSARLGLELGADFVNLRYNEDTQAFPWLVKCAGKTRVLISGGEKTNDKKLLETVHSAMRGHITGAVVGRNIWQHPKPFSMTQAIQDIVFKHRSVEHALQRLQ